MTLLAAEKIDGSADPRNVRRAQMSWSAAPGKFLLIGFGLLFFMTCLNVWAALQFHATTEELPQRVASLFLFDRESNFATFFNFSLIIIDVAFLATVAAAAWVTRSAWRWHWAVLCVLFLVLAYDEASTLHEHLNTVAKQFVRAEGVLLFPWVIFGAAFVALLGVGYLRFTVALDPAVRKLVILSGVLFVGGAIGVELLGASYADRRGLQGSLGYEAIATVEEVLEMSGLIVFGYALLRALDAAGARVSVVVDAAKLSRDRT